LSLTVATIVSAPALGAPHLEPCIRLAGYEERVEQLMRESSAQKLELLAIMYGWQPERGIGLTRSDEGFELVRLEFDVSFWYSSWRDVAANSDEAASAAIVATEVFRADGAPLGAQVLDFSATRVRVTHSTLPISRELGNRLLDALARSAADARVEEPTEEILTDGYSYEILLSARPCVELRNPPRGSPAGEIADLLRLLDSGLQRWQASDAFEAEVQRRIPR
jgi:hypothetical protein